VRECERSTNPKRKCKKDNKGSNKKEGIIIKEGGGNRSRCSQREKEKAINGGANENENV